MPSFSPAAPSYSTTPVINTWFHKKKGKRLLGENRYRKGEATTGSVADGVASPPLWRSVEIGSRHLAAAGMHSAPLRWVLTLALAHPNGDANRVG